VNNGTTQGAKQEFDLKYANRSLILFAVLSAFVLYVDIMLTPSLPKIGSEFGVNTAQVSLILSLYTVFGTAINPIVGKMGDIYGKKKVLTYVLIIYSVMVTTTSFAPNFEVLLLSRTFQGIGLGIFPLAFSLIREEFPRELVPRAQGLISAMFGAGTAIGLPVGAFVANSYGWQANYHIATPFIVALTILMVFYVKESAYKNSDARMDYVGAGLLGVSLGMIVFGLSEGSTWGWTSAPVLGLVLGGASLFVPLVPFERRFKTPLLNFKLLRTRNVFISNAVGLVFGMAMFLAFQAISYKLELPSPAGYGFDILTTGFYLLPLAVSLLVVTYPVGVLISKVGVKPFLFLGSIVGAAGFFLISTATNAAQIAGYLVVASAGLGMLMVSTQNLLVLTVKTQEMGLATSMNTVFRNIGSSLGAPIAGSLLSTYTVTQLVGSVSVTFPSQTAFQYSFYIAVIGFVVSLIFCLFSREVLGKRV
jgi:MFS family permease